MPPRKKSNAVSTEVSVGELKNRLSEYLRAVEAGRVVTVVSHRRPVARLVPPDDTGREHVRKARRPWGTTQRPRMNAGKTDSTALLLEERRKDRR
jgi:prevent-host-death family protein